MKENCSAIFFLFVKRYSKFLPISIYELMETIVEKNIIEPLQTVISIRVTRFRMIIHRMCIESSMLKFWTNNRFKESYTPLSIYHLFLPVYSKKEKGTMINVPAQSLCQLIPKPLIPSSRYTIQGYIRLRHRHAHSREFQWPRFPVPFQIGKDGKSPKFELKNKEEKRERRKKKRKKRKKNARDPTVARWANKHRRIRQQRRCQSAGSIMGPRVQLYARP